MGNANNKGSVSINIRSPARTMIQKNSKVEKFTRCLVGLLNGAVNFGIVLAADPPGTYAMATISTEGHFGDFRFSELPVGVRPEPPNVRGIIYGCGILMDPDNKLTTFFTLNGILLGEFYLEVWKKFKSEKSQKVGRIFLINFL
jgi:hypothetical protein